MPPSSSSSSSSSTLAGLAPPPPPPPAPPPSTSDPSLSHAAGGRVKIVFKPTPTEQESTPTDSPGPDFDPNPKSAPPPAAAAASDSGTVAPGPGGSGPPALDVVGTLEGFTAESSSATTTTTTTNEAKKAKGSSKSGKAKGKKRAKTAGSTSKSRAPPRAGEPSAAGPNVGGGPDAGPASSTTGPAVLLAPRPGPPPPPVAGPPIALNRVCHHHKSMTKGEIRMSCTNKPACRTIWCKNCIDKYYLEFTPTGVFIEGTTFVCPVCSDRCKCASCRKKRKEHAKETRRSNSTSTLEPVAVSRSSTPRVVGTSSGVGGDAVVKMEDDADVSPSTAPPPPPFSSSSSLRASTSSTLHLPAADVAPSVSTALPPAPAAPPRSGILKIRVKPPKPPKRPRTERGTFIPQHHQPGGGVHPLAGGGHDLLGDDDDEDDEDEDDEDDPLGEFGFADSGGGGGAGGSSTQRSGRGGARKGAGRRAGSSAGGGGAGHNRASIYPSDAHHLAHAEHAPASFFARPPPPLMGFGGGIVGVGGAAGAGGPRPKRTKKKSSHYDDFSVEGVPNFVAEDAADLERGGRETRSHGAAGRWGGYRRGAGGKRKSGADASAASALDAGGAGAHPSGPPLFPSALPTAAMALMAFGRDGKPRRRPRLSGLSSASSCSELSSAGDGIGYGDDDGDDDDDYWDAKAELDERESDQRVRHWLLVPPTEPQPVLAGLERNLSFGEGDEVGFSPTTTTTIQQGKKRKEKVKWIEGPERRRRRALAVQKMKEEEDAKMRDAVKEDQDPKRSLKRSLSFDASQTDRSYNHCSPIKPFGDGLAPSAATSTSASPPDRKLPLPIRPASAPNLSSIELEPATAGTAPSPEVKPPLHAPHGSDAPPPYESAFPPSVHTPILPSPAHPSAPAIVVSPATAAPSPHPLAPSSLSAEAADLAARSADDKRLGLRLLDAIRSITGTQLAMEAMGIPSSALPASTPLPSAPLSAPVPAPPAVATSPVKSETDDAFSSLISQEHAEYEALRREERQRILSTALDPQKVFRAEAKGNDVSLLERAAWGVGGMDVDSDETAERTTRGGGRDSGVLLHFDFESFLDDSRQTEQGRDDNHDEPTPSWHASSSSSSASTSLVASASVTPTSSHAPSALAMTAPAVDPTAALSHHHAGAAHDRHHHQPPFAIPVPPATPSKPLLSSTHHLSAPVSSFTSSSYDSTPSLGGAATPTRGLVMELDFDFDHHHHHHHHHVGNWATSLDEMEQH
ncbi:hypothetical protein JCM11491_005954 [Sporobolomyces phaffii]